MKRNQTEFYCDICHAPMVLMKTVGTKQSGRSYRKRRFGCTVCDYTKLIHAEGMFDEIMLPRIALNAVNSMFKKEERARL